MTEQTQEQQPEALTELLKWIDPPEYRLKVKEILERYWSIFSNIPASKSGRYHHVTENFKPYGLINHTFRCLEVAKLLCEQHGLPQADRDMVYSALVIHDVGKVFYYEVGIRANIDHSDKAAKIAMAEGLPVDVVQMVAHHMSHWDGYPLNSNLERLVAYADYIASKPEIELKNAIVFRPDPYPDISPDQLDGDLAVPNINTLEVYFNINEQIKNLEKQKEELRKKVIRMVKPDKTLIIGNYCANINERNRTDIDKKVLQSLVSEDILSKVTKTSTSTALSVDQIE